MLDDRSRSGQFPSLAGMTYLNTAAEGIPPLEVGAALERYFRDRQRGAPGREAHMAEWRALRSRAASMLGLDSAGQVAFCSSSSEAFNLLSLALRLRPGDEVVVNDLDFPAGRTPWLLPECPAEVRVWRSREGALRTEDLAPLLGPHTRLVAASLVSFYNGFTLPAEEVAETVRRRSPALFALDVTQALGRIPLRTGGADLLVSSTHKWICGSHGGGIAGLASPRAAELTVPAGGWFHLRDPFDRPADAVPEPQPGAASFMVGMPNFPAVYAVRAALEYINGVGVERIDRRARPLVRRCLEELRSLPVQVLTPPDDASLAGIVAFRHERMEELAARLEAAGIFVMHSAGRIRVSIHGYNTEQEIERLLRVLRAAL